jgi:hypothetical protein
MSLSNESIVKEKLLCKMEAENYKRKVYFAQALL